MDRKTMFINGVGTWHDILFVDPGVGGTGYAKYDELVRTGRKTKRDAKVPTTFGVLHAASTSKGEKSVDEICAKFRSLLEVTHSEHVFMEYPRYFSGSAKSHAATVKGDLILLTYLIGGLGEIVRTVTGRSPVLIFPEDWKKGLPKKIVLDRLEEFLGIKFKNHEADAVGMGLYFQGFLT